MEVAGSVVGIVGLGLQICQGLLSYYESSRYCHRDVADLCLSIEGLERILQLLEGSVNGRQLDLDAAKCIKDSMDLCGKSLNKLEKKLVKIKNSQGAEGFRQQAKKQLIRVSYPFKESTLLKLRDIVHDQKSDLSLALHALHM
jgi:hypothetical protein